MKLIKITFSILVVLLPILAFSQSTKTYFDKQGKPASIDLAYYYRTSLGGDSFKSFYTNENPYFEGRIIKLDKQADVNNTYAGVCKWYYKNGKLKYSKTFDDKGVENGVSTHYFESGKLWKEITYVNGKIKDNSYVEYDETGLSNRIFEEDFLNNSNDWDVYASNKSIATITNGTLELTSSVQEGTSRFINIANNSSDIIVEALIDISSLKQGSKAGIIYGFKDWQNYNFFVITNTTFFVGTVFEGLSAMRAEDMYAGNILKSGYNNLKILNIDDKCVFSINGEVQLNTDSYRLYGSKVGFIVSGTNKIIVDKLITKEVDFKGSNNNASNSAEDQNVKGTGSGLIVSKTGYIVTNYHVIDEAKSIVVETRHEGVVKSYNAVVIKSDKDNDISILKIDDKNFTNFSRIQYAFKETGALEVGTSVYTIGFPLALTGMGKEAKFTDGKISAKTGYNNAINSFQTTVPVQPGNSGGPLFDDKGKLIGLVNAKIQEADNVSYAIKLNYLKNLIEVLPETIDLPNDYSINTLPLQEQVKVLSNYVVLIKIK
jgi:S1-C subfamily serine protease